MRLVEFTTTALRLAEVWKGSAAGNVIAFDLENGRYYFVIADGAGANKMVPMPEQFGYVEIPLDAWCEVTSGGDVGVITANGGKLASDTTPILLGDAAESWAIQWAAGNADPISMSTGLPRDFDGTRDAYLLAETSSGGTTDLASMTCETSWDGAALVSDALTGLASVTVSERTVTIAAADIPDAPKRVTVALTPAAHATDAMNLLSTVLKYYRK